MVNIQNIMEIKTRIQKTRSIDLTKKLKDKIKENKYNQVKWTIYKNNEKIQIKFIKTDKNKKDKITSQKTVIYRNIYGNSSITIPKLVFEKLNCKIYDDIILTITQEKIIVTSSEKIRIKDLSGILNKTDGDNNV